MPTISPLAGSTALLILGMHRSGTSATAGVFGRLGVALGNNLMKPQPENPKSFYEHAGIVAMHDAILGALGRHWDDPRQLPKNWHTHPGMSGFRTALIRIIESDFANRPLWGVKDPRLCRLLPLWLDLLPTLGVSVKALLVARNPREVARSLTARNRMAPEHADTLWLLHNLEAGRHIRDFRATVLPYDDLLDDWRRETKRINNDLGLGLMPLREDSAHAIAGFLDRDLRHQKIEQSATYNAPQNLYCTPVYHAILRWRRAGIFPAGPFQQAETALRAAACMATPLSDYLDIALPRTTEAAHQDNAALHGELPAARREIARLRAQLARRVLAEAG